jgi:steroid 5-alpha reductase family enzyme
MLLAAVVLLAYMTLVYVYALKIKNNSIADIAYGGGFVVVGGTAFAVGSQPKIGLYVLGLVLFWAIRLSGRIYKRNHKKPEDFRYAAWRKQWKWLKLRSYLQVFVLQGVIIYIVALPILAIAVHPTQSLHVASLLLGSLVWLIGYFFEVVGDAQLDAFLKIRPEKRPTKFIESGLWRYTRHPNYFGEATMWWGLAIIANGNSSLGLIIWASPVLITYLLLFVSGVPLLEKRWAGDKAWEKYKAKTSVFLPLPPKGN